MSASPPIAVAAGSLARNQRIHAFLILLLPFVASLFAVWRSFELGFTLVEPVTFVLMYSISLLGITVGYHRYLSHRSFHAKPVLKAALTIMGALSAQGPPFYWTANHRRHHQFSDREGDPHSPHATTAKTVFARFLHAHTGWAFGDELTHTARFCKDLLRDPLLASLNRRYYAWIGLGLLVPTLIGLGMNGGQGAFTGFLWGGMVRLFVSYHATNAVNSICHLWGSQPFKTREHSRNQILLVLPTFGEGWHNNHHAFPSSARLGLLPRQLDLGYLFIQLCVRCKLANDVKQPDAAAISARLQTKEEP